MITAEPLSKFLQFYRIEQHDNGIAVLVCERCPYLHAAARNPAILSIVIRVHEKYCRG